MTSSALGALGLSTQTYYMYMLGMYVRRPKMPNPRSNKFRNCRIVEFSSGGTKLERFLPKNQHTQRKLLNFENWCSGKLSKSAKI